MSIEKSKEYAFPRLNIHRLHLYEIIIKENAETHVSSFSDIYPISNVLYQEHDSSQAVINFGKNSECYGVKTKEVECPLHGNHKNDGVNTEKEEPHNFNMKNNQDPNPITGSDNNSANNV